MLGPKSYRTEPPVYTFNEVRPLAFRSDTASQSNARRHIQLLRLTSGFLIRGSFLASGGSQDESANSMNWVRQKTTSNYTAVIMNPQQAFEILLNIPEPRRTLVLTDAATALRVSEILGLMWMDLDFSDQVIEVKRAYVWPSSKCPSPRLRRHPYLCTPCWLVS